MSSIMARRYIEVGDDQNSDIEEHDALIEVEVDGPEIDLHLSPRTDDVATCSLSVEEAWRLARELAKAAAFAGKK